MKRSEIFGAKKDVRAAAQRELLKKITLRSEGRAPRGAEKLMQQLLVPSRGGEAAAGIHDEGKMAQ